MPSNTCRKIQQHHSPCRSKPCPSDEGMGNKKFIKPGNEKSDLRMLDDFKRLRYVGKVDSVFRSNLYLVFIGIRTPFHT